MQASKTYKLSANKRLKSFEAYLSCQRRLLNQEVSIKYKAIRKLNNKITVSYALSRYLIEIIQPTLSKNKHHIIYSNTLVQEHKTWEIYKHKVSV